MYPQVSGSGHGYPHQQGQHMGGHAQPGQQMPAMGGFENMAAIAENQMFQNFAKQSLHQAGAQFTTSILPEANTFWSNLRYYFHVDNRYVLRKLGLLVFPWRHKKWERIRFGDESMASDSSAARQIEFAPPVSDVNAPDLYLPVMASITYILFIGLLKGTKKSFNPDVLQNTFTTCTLVLMLEVAIMKAGLYSLPGSPERKLAVFDMVSFAGYKYVLVALNLFIGIALGSTVYNVVMFYLCLCMGFFIYRTLEQALPQMDYESAGHKRRMYYLIACAALQFLTIFFLGFTRDLGESSVPGISFSAFSDDLDDDEADV